jgi:type IV pilus assembly protein PilM
MSLFGRKRNVIGLDVGSGFVKIVMVDHSGDQPEVVRVAVRPLPLDAIVEGEIMDYGLVSDTVMGLFQSLGMRGAEVVTAVGGPGVIIKKIEMDRTKDSDAREAIKWEAELHVPFDTNSVELDFQILDPNGDGLQMEVLLVAAKRELLDNKIGLLQDAGVEPILIDVDAFALHNAFEYNYPDAQDGIVGLVNVGHETTNVTILENGVLILTRDIPFGSRKIREDLQRGRGLTAEQAESVVQGREAAIDLESFVQISADEVAVGIEHASAFLGDGNTVGRIFLSGGGARIPGLSQTLATRIGVETEIVNPFERIPVRPDAAVGLSLDEAAPMLLLPLGLALRA